MIIYKKKALGTPMEALGGQPELRQAGGSFGGFSNSINPMPSKSAKMETKPPIDPSKWRIGVNYTDMYGVDIPKGYIDASNRNFAGAAFSGKGFSRDQDDPLNSTPYKGTVSGRYNPSGRSWSTARPIDFSVRRMSVMDEEGNPVIPTRRDLFSGSRGTGSLMTTKDVIDKVAKSVSKRNPRY